MKYFSFSFLFSGFTMDVFLSFNSFFMNSVHAVYKCPLCGNMVEMVHAGEGELVCCGRVMMHLNENTTDAATEKHVPVVTKTDNGIHVVVGDVGHPMTDDHYIEWIEVIADGVSYKKFLNPGDKPEADFCLEAKEIEVREYCNLHGLWKV
jgi:superoxide reductase